MVKNRNSKESAEDAKKERQDARKVKTEVVELPEGRRVMFKTVRDDYLVDIRKISINDASISVNSDGGQINVEKADLVVEGIAVDPKKGAMFDSMKLSGLLRKGDQDAGKFNMSYKSVETKVGVRTNVNLSAKSVDLAAIEFIFDDSLPVDVQKGILDINSNTEINNEDLNSKNKLTLTSFNLQPGSGKSMMVGIIPMPALCEALNQVDPLKLNFNITGTLDDPKFSGFEDTIKEVAKPYLQNVEKQAVGKLTGLLEKKAGSETTEGASGDSGESTTQQAVDSIKSLFGK